MVNKNQVIDLISKYEMKVENVQIEVNNAQRMLHPELPGLFVKYEIPKEVPKEKREVIERKLIKKIKEENKGITCFFIKEMHQLNEEYVNKVISEAKIEGDKEKELMGLRMRVLISGDFNPFDMFFNNYKRGFDEIFSLFEKFSNDLFSIYGNWMTQYILERRSIHGINKINDNYKKLLGIDLAMNFKYWKELAKYHYMRNIFIHKDGVIDKDFITNLKKLNLPFEQYKLGDKLQLTSKIFNDAIEIIKKTFSFIKTNLN